MGPSTSGTGGANGNTRSESKASAAADNLSEGGAKLGALGGRPGKEAAAREVPPPAGWEKERGGRRKLGGDTQKAVEATKTLSDKPTAFR